LLWTLSRLDLGSSAATEEERFQHFILNAPDADIVSMDAMLEQMCWFENPDEPARAARKVDHQQGVHSRCF